jgi:DNA polymerase alpha subunit A
VLKVDDDYYFKQQLIPVLSRLLDPIDGIDDQMIAECFGLDPKDFRSKAAQRARIEREAENVLVAMAKEEDKLINCDLLDVKASVHPEKRDYIIAQVEICLLLSLKPV